MLFDIHLSWVDLKLIPCWLQNIVKVLEHFHQLFSNWLNLLEADHWFAHCISRDRKYWCCFEDFSCQKHLSKNEVSVPMHAHLPALYMFCLKLSVHTWKWLSYFHSKILWPLAGNIVCKPSHYYDCPWRHNPVQISKYCSFKPYFFCGSEKGLHWEYCYCCEDPAWAKSTLSLTLHWWPMLLHPHISRWGVSCELPLRYVCSSS